MSNYHNNNRFRGGGGRGRNQPYNKGGPPNSIPFILFLQLNIYCNVIVSFQVFIINDITI